MISPPNCLTRSAAALAEPPNETILVSYGVPSGTTEGNKKKKKKKGEDGRGWSAQKKHTGGNDIVDNQDLLTRLNGVFLHLEQVDAILLPVLGRHARARQLALLANGSEADGAAEGQTRPEEEAAGVQADDDVRGRFGVELLDLEVEGRDEGFVDGRVEEEGHDVDEVDALDGEVGEVAQGGLELHLPTGEFGGTGGGGGGVASRGMLVWVRDGGDGGGLGDGRRVDWQIGG